MRPPRTTLLLAVLALSFAGAPTWAPVWAPAWASARAGTARPAEHTEVARYSFDGRGSGLMLARGSIRIGAGAVFAFVSVDLTNPHHPQAFFGQVLDLGTPDGIRSYGAAGAHRLCTAPLSCRISGGTFSFDASYTVDASGSPPTHLRFYLALRGAQLSLHESLLGWRVHHRSGGLLIRSDADAAGVGVDVTGTDFGVTTGVFAPGPAGGSVGILVPGCDQLGAGALTLTGGSSSTTAVCPSYPVSAYAPGATTWSATGAAGGVSANQTRLAVIAA
ncbi:MAG TPA: hypothetical protein VNE21_01785 [Mycobacteriales bacterium]|nr:hypothetical protein [Mycobacteriales bacterium]